MCHYLCGHCQWTSQECGVTSNGDKLLDYSTSDDMDASAEKEAEKQRGIAIVEISSELEICLQQRMQEKNKVGDALMNSITKMWAEREQEEQRRKRMMIRSTMPNSGIDSGRQSWSLETLEQSLSEKKKELDSPYTHGKEGSDPAAVESNETKNAGKKIPTPQQMAAQMTLTTTTPQYRSDLFPLPVPYRTRVSRRCRAELAEGRTGILIKPKLNPLEGDSSLRAGHGQWWKKDSSAVYVVPRVQLCRNGVDPTSQKYAALLKVKNPTLNMIRLRLSGWSIPAEEKDGAVSPLIDSRELQNVLLDPFTEMFVQGRLCAPTTAASLSPTDFFVLDPADDPFLDIGKGQEDDPSEVRDWDAMSTMGALGDGNTSQLRLVATQGDTAWIELVLCNDAAADEDSSTYLAVPLTMQIEVGNGSWEASLIKRRDLPVGEKDLVALNLVTLLR